MSKTQPMTVGNPTFLVDRLGLDCAPLQYVRELTQNSIDAILKRRDLGWSEIGQIIWDVDWKLVQSSGLYKLQISDNGIGMTGPEIEKYINSLSSSGSEQGFAKNFGVGAKISAGKENPAGLVYKSWRNNHGVMATFWNDPDVGYGLEQVKVGESFSHYAPVLDDLKCPPIDSDTCGTSVTLMGSTRDENTMIRHNQKQKWLIQYLNSRYFELPDQVEIKVRDFSQSSPSDWPTRPDTGMGTGGSQLRSIRGMNQYLKQYAVHFGSVQLSNATAHWYILPRNNNTSGGVWDEKSQVGTLFQSELYDMKRTKDARTTLISFGVIYGHDQITLYVEPDVSKLNIVANTARSQLLVVDGENGTPMPWADWAAEFRQLLPLPIRQLMEDILSKAESANYEDEVKKRLKEIQELLQPTRYKAKESGAEYSVPNLRTDTVAETGQNQNATTDRNGKSSVGRNNQDLYAAFVDETGTPSEVTKPNDGIPTIQWISLDAGTRSVGQIEDKAASYSHEQNLILANADFRGFGRIIDVLAGEYQHADVSTIKQTVQSWISLQLTEAVVGILSLKGSPEWSSSDDIHRALSDEALTTTVMARYSAFSQMRRQLGSKIGRAEQH